MAVSETVKKYSVEQLGVPAEKCLTIPNGIDLSCFTPETRQEALCLRRELGFSEKDFVFVAVASINRHKRILALLKSFRCIRDLAPNARLVLIGYPYDQGYLNEILTYIDKNDLRDRVSYAGHSTTSALYYLMADAFVHGSGSEGGQLVLLEALAANLAIVTTDVGFAHHFAQYPGIQVVDRDFPYTHASFTNAKAFHPSSGLVADLAWAMLQTCRSNIRPNLPQNVIAAFDAKQTYARYEQFIADILKRPPQTEPTADWSELLPEPSVGSVAPLSINADDIAGALRVIATYEAIVAERDIRIVECDTELAALRDSLEGVFQSKSWKITSPLRAAMRIFRNVKEGSTS